MKENIQVDVDLKTSLIDLSVTMQDPLVSALLTDTILKNLQKYITDYKIAQYDVIHLVVRKDKGEVDFYYNVLNLTLKVVYPKYYTSHHHILYYGPLFLTIQIPAGFQPHAQICGPPQIWYIALPQE